MNNIIKVVLLLFILLYIVSPVDACPGPIDDIIVALLGLATIKRRSEIEE